MLETLVAGGKEEEGLGESPQGFYVECARRRGRMGHGRVGLPSDSARKCME